MVSWTVNTEEMERPGRSLSVSSSLHPLVLSYWLDSPGHMCASCWTRRRSADPALENKHRQRAGSPELVSGEHNGHLIFSEAGFRRVTHVLA